MVDLLTIYPGVDVNRIGMLGICGGGGYTLNAAKSEKRVKAVATLSMFNSGRVRREGYMSTQISDIQARLIELTAWDAVDNIKLINVPLLMMAGNQQVKKFFERTL